MNSLQRIVSLGCICGLATNWSGAQATDSATLSEISPVAPLATTSPSVEATIQKLQDPDPSVRWRAARSLGRQGESAKAAEPVLLKLLEDPDPTVQVYAIVAVERLKLRSKEAIAGLTNCIKSSDPRVVRTAILTLGKMQLEPEELATAMESLFSARNQDVLVYAVDAIVDSGERATPLLQAALKEGDDAAYWASIAIAEIGPSASATVPQLMAALENADDPETRARILMALAKIGPEAREAVTGIEKLLKQQPGPTEALIGAYALGAIGTVSDSAVLLPLAKAKQEPLAMVASWALAKTSTQDKVWREQAIEKMLAGLASESPLVRSTAAKGLMDLKPTNEVVTARLIEAIQDPDPDVAANIAEALASLGPSIVPGIAKSLDDPRMQPLLINVLGRLGPDSEPAVPQLISMLPNANTEMKTRIHFVLAGIGPAAGPATSAILDSLNDTEPRARQSALFALRQIGPGAVDALPQLVAQLESSKGAEQLSTAWAIARISPDKDGLPPKLAEVLKQGLSSSNPAIRYESTTAIATLGSGTEQFREELKRIAEGDPDEQVRHVAAQAMQDKAQ